MKLFPAIDLKNNMCVRLQKGKDTSSKIFNKNPVEQAIYFEKKGCERLHLVDLDSAFGRKNVNTKSIDEIRKAIKIPIQIGGGIRSKEDATNYLNQNIDYLIIGSLAVTNFETVINLANLYKDKIYVSLDILDSKIMINGWEKKSQYETKDIFLKYNNSNIRGYVLTDVSRDGMMTGLNTEIIKSNLQLTSKKLIVGGGLASHEDLVKLKYIKSKNLEGVIAGKSIYVGNVKLKKAQEILNQNA